MTLKAEAKKCDVPTHQTTATTRRLRIQPPAAVDQAWTTIDCRHSTANRILSLVPAPKSIVGKMTKRDGFTLSTVL